MSECYLNLGASTTRYGIHDPLLLVQLYWVFGVYQHVAEGDQWMKDHLDAQLCAGIENCSYLRMDCMDITLFMRIYRASNNLK